MKTAILVLNTFRILCPFCEVALHAADGTEFFTTPEVEAGQIKKCEACGREFRLPTTLKATSKQVTYEVQRQG